MNNTTVRSIRVLTFILIIILSMDSVYSLKATKRSRKPVEKRVKGDIERRYKLKKIGKDGTIKSGTEIEDNNKIANEIEIPEEDDKLKYEKEKNDIYTRIRKLLVGNKYKEIKKELNSLSKKYSVETDREYFFYIGVVYEKKSLYRKAVESYLKAIELSKDYSRARNSLGNLYCRLHKYHFAIDHFLKALDSNPFNPFINYNLGNLYYDIGDYDNALKYIQNAIEYKKNFGSAYHKLGIILFKKKKYLNSIKNLQSAIKFKKKSHTTYYYIGLSYFHIEKGSKAIYYIKRALAIKDDFFEAALELGKIYQSYGEFENALLLYKRSRMLNPDYDEVALLMVDCYRELRRYSKAIIIIKSLLKRYPENKRLHRYLRNLQDKRLIENLSEPYDYYGY